MTSTSLPITTITITTCGPAYPHVLADALASLLAIFALLAGMDYRTGQIRFDPFHCLRAGQIAS
jgi:hypothetical protein